MRTKEQKAEYDRKYGDSYIKRFNFGFNVKTDADILDKLDSVGNKQAYIKRLIRDDRAQ